MMIYHSRKLEDTYNEQDIWRSLIPHVSFSGFFKLRPEGKASATMRYYNNKWYLKSFGDPNQDKAETFIDYTMRMYNLDFNEALEYLRNMNINVSKQYVTNYTDAKDTSKDIILDIRARPFTKHDEKYWNSMNVSLSQLEAKQIQSVQYIYMNIKSSGFILNYTVKSNELAFSYPHGYNKSGIYMRTVYMPFHPKLKFLKNIDNTVIQNIHFQKEPTEYLWTMNAFKDILVLENFVDDNIIGLNTEGTYLSANQIKQTDKLFTKERIYFADNDYYKEPNPGLEYAKKYHKRYGLNYVFLPSEHKVTDISEFVLKYGEKETAKQINSFRASFSE